jgi:hypothetical protein
MSQRARGKGPFTPTTRYRLFRRSLLLSSDPRHPVYGRNQIATQDRVLSRLEELCPGLISFMIRQPLPFRMLETEFEAPLLRPHSTGGYRFQFHSGYLRKADLRAEHDYKGFSLSAVVEAVAMEQSFDMALNEFDVLLLSNWHCLHRRGACTLRFGQNLLDFDGRRIRTLRFSSST